MAYYPGSHAGSRGLSASAYLAGPPVGYNLGHLVGHGVGLCHRSSLLLVRWHADEPGDRCRVPRAIILNILARELIFTHEGDLLPGPGRALLVDGLALSASVVASLSSILAASVTVVAVVGRLHPLPVTLSLMLARPPLVA